MRSTTDLAANPRGLGWLAASEMAAALLGFAATVHVARRLDPGGFAVIEHAVVIAAWLLVVVRSGVEQIAQREAARRPRLVGSLANHLIGLKCLAATVGFLALLLITSLEGDNERLPLVVAGLILFPSAIATDLGPRVRGRLGVVAAAQALRAISMALCTAALVRDDADLALAALCPVLGELVAALYLIHWHGRSIGPIRPTLRLRPCLALARRGTLASVNKFLRVGLYAADLVALGWLTLPEAGAYAAARRVVFAAVAVGLVVPAGFGPSISAGWAAGRGPAREAVRVASRRVLRLACPAALGLALTGHQAVPWVFGEGYEPRGLWLPLLAARLPLLLLASVSLTALVACRRERQAVLLTLGMGLVATLALFGSARLQRLDAVAAALLATEAFGAVVGWIKLRSLGIAPPWHHDAGPVALGCLSMVLACWMTRGWALPAQIGMGGLAYMTGLSVGVLGDAGARHQRFGEATT